MCYRLTTGPNNVFATWKRSYNAAVIWFQSLLSIHASLYVSEVEFIPEHNKRLSNRLPTVTTKWLLI